MNLWRLGKRGGVFGQQHGDGVSLFARGAGRDPNPHLVARLFLLQQLRDDFAFERLECLAVAEEVGDADKQVL